MTVTNILEYRIAFKSLSIPVHACNTRIKISKKNTFLILFVYLLMSLHTTKSSGFQLALKATTPSQAWLQNLWKCGRAQKLPQGKRECRALPSSSSFLLSVYTPRSKHSLRITAQNPNLNYKAASVVAG